MAERGALPEVSPVRRRALRLIGSFTSPLAPDDYLELVNPLWSTRELRGRVQSVRRESADAVTVLIKPGWDWPGHRPGQYVRLGVAVEGVHHWRAYSLTSEPRRADGCIAITPKLVEGGRVSPFLNRRLRRGTIVRLGGVEGTFVLPEPTPARLLFVSAGSGITPIASMLRALAAAGELRDVVHVHCSRTREGVAFARELAALHVASNGYSLHLHISGERGRLAPCALDALCPDWSEREAFLCGPAGLRRGAHAAPGTRRAILSACTSSASSHTRTSATASAAAAARSACAAAAWRRAATASSRSCHAAEAAGATLPFGCRMGICHSCVGRLRSGCVRDLRTGRVHGQPGELLQTCVNAPEGAVEIDL